MQHFSLRIQIKQVVGFRWTPGVVDGQGGLACCDSWGRKESDTSNWTELISIRGFPDDSAGKESACSAGDPGSISGSGRSPREGNGNPLQYSCLENPRDRGAWQAAAYGVAQSQTRLKRLGSSSREYINEWFEYMYSSNCWIINTN